MKKKKNCKAEFAIELFLISHSLSLQKGVSYRFLFYFA